MAVRQAKAKKPVVAHIDDLGASAAYWVASQAQRITANPTAEVGSLGTLAVVPDLSGMAARDGIQIHVVSTGPYKGMGIPGTAITEEHLAEVQRRVNNVNAFFMSAVRTGRRMTTAQMQAVSDGRVWIAEEAQQLGLIDAVRPLETAMREVAGIVNASRREQTKDQIAQRRATLTTLAKESAHAPSNT
jgi:protease-4